MANIYDNRTPQPQQGFNPNTDNRPVQAMASGFAKTVWFLSFITIIPIVAHVIILNKLRRSQNDINNSASGIDVQLTKRSATLTKMFESVKGYTQHEKELFENVTRMRNLSQSGQTSPEARQELSNLNNSVFGRLLAVSENYPEIKANTLFQQLMEESAYIEREIAAARRLYNSQVTFFNQHLFVFPTNVVARISNLWTVPLYQASEQERSDVEIKF